ncbi:AfsR/SARP family transcriptional regulator [Streptomyces apocyni]|uniref:AfsR/SARP family transcriptional regulator n=1 Tax=Streptomyces apocyni TaxID=2654677 RepID=UPI00227865DD|nr:BTAD domain-containing putative transcriptional regulator [Streptomyces apocyni]
MEFLVLGPLEVSEAGMPVRLRGMRRRRLLALLLLNARRPVSMDTLVDELWQDPPASARHQVHNAIRDLRAALATSDGGGLATSDGCGLATVDIGYRLDVPPDAVDTHRFAEWARAARTARRAGRDAEAIRLLRSAVDLWRGDAFAGIDCPAVTAAAAGLEEQRLTAVEELMELRLAAGETGSLVAELSALSARHPLRDALRGSLMLALYRSGRQADALAVYDDGRRLLTDELGLEPGPRLRRLHSEILSDAPRAQRAATTPERHEASTPHLPAGTTPGRPAGTTLHQPTGTTPHQPAEATPGQPESATPHQPVSTTPVQRATTRPGRGNYLPRDLPDFTGRTTELALLDRAIDDQRPGSPHTVTIDGMGGIGKTALAVHFAHRRGTDYPDGQYYIDLHGFTPDRAPLAPEEALGVILRSAGTAPEAIPAGLAERSALWRSRLTDRRALLVLDNAADAAQVAPLLPGSGDTLTLITTRRKLTAPDGSRALPLGALTPEDAETLFRHVAADARTGPPLTQAVALCGHHPLALRIAATRLRDRPSWTVPDATARLRTSAGRAAFLRTADRDLMSVLALSYAQLPPDAQQPARALALHSATTQDIPRACAITGLAPSAVERLFDTLLDHNLAHEPSPAHLSIPLLLRDCARTLTPPAHHTTRPLKAVA